MDAQAAVEAASSTARLVSRHRAGQARCAIGTAPPGPITSPGRAAIPRRSRRRRGRGPVSPSGGRCRRSRRASSGKTWLESQFPRCRVQALAVAYGTGGSRGPGIDIAEAAAAIVRDPDNPYDSDAVAVWIDGERLVGHLPRDVAAQYARRLESLDRGTFLQVPARCGSSTGARLGRARRSSSSDPWRHCQRATA